MKCANHELEAASGTCAYCGKFFCGDCLVEVGGRNYCKADIGNVVAEAKESNQTQQQHPMVFMNAGGGGGGASSSSSAAAASGGALEQRRGVNHVLHAILTVFTAGFWLPVWIGLIILDSLKR